MAGTVGLATETDAALALGGAVSGAVGLATEIDAAFALGTGIALPVGLATETDTAFALVCIVIGQVLNAAIPQSRRQRADSAQEWQARALPSCRRG